MKLPFSEKTKINIDVDLRFLVIGATSPEMQPFSGAVVPKVGM